MLQLFIDTATEKAFIGLSLEEKLLETVLLPRGLQNSKFLFTELMTLFARHQVFPKDLNLIGCGIGPGSYTGIRVGAASAQSMAYALKLPLVGLCSLQSYIPSKVGAFAVAFDARYGGVYLQKGHFDGVKAQFEERPNVVALDALGDRLEGVEMFLTPHVKELKERAGSYPWEETEPSGELFARQVYERYRNKQFSAQASLDLLYLRKTQAELERK